MQKRSLKSRLPRKLRKRFAKILGLPRRFVSPGDARPEGVEPKAFLPYHLRALVTLGEMVAREHDKLAADVEAGRELFAEEMHKISRDSPLYPEHHEALVNDKLFRDVRRWERYLSKQEAQHESIAQAFREEFDETFPPFAGKDVVLFGDWSFVLVPRIVPPDETPFDDLFVELLFAPLDDAFDPFFTDEDAPFIKRFGHGMPFVRRSGCESPMEVLFGLDPQFAVVVRELGRAGLL